MTVRSRSGWRAIRSRCGAREGFGSVVRLRLSTRMRAGGAARVPELAQIARGALLRAQRRAEIRDEAVRGQRCVASKLE